MRFPGDYNFYCERLGRQIHVRSWNRLILDLGLDNLDLFQRRPLLAVVADIRKIKPLAPVNPELAYAYKGLVCLQSAIEEGTELSGLQIYKLVYLLRPISFRAVQSWGTPHGLRLAPTHKYRGGELKSWFNVILIRLPAMRKVQSSLKNISTGALQHVS